MKTEMARKAPEEVPLKKNGAKSSNACTIVMGFFNQDIPNDMQWYRRLYTDSARQKTGYQDFISKRKIL